MKKTALLMLSVFLAVCLIVSGCGGQQAAETAGSDTNNQEQQVIELKFNDWGPPGIGIGKLHDQAAKMIEEKTNGRVKVTNYFSQSLLKLADTYKGVASGVADISLYYVGATPGVQNINRIFALPVAGLPDMIKTAQIYEQLLKDYPELQQENEKTGTKWIAIRAMPPSQLHMVKNEIKVPKDLNGKKIITSGQEAGQLVTNAGGAPINVGPPDWYTSLEKGLAEAHLVHWVAVSDFKTLELFNKHTNIGEGGLGMTAIGFIVNKEKWDSLPADVQQVIVETYQWVNEESLKYDVEANERAQKEALDAGHTITVLNPDEIQQWADALKPIQDKWIEEMESKGYPARKIFDGLQQLIKESK